MSVAKLFIPVGIPGCGKSTFAKHSMGLDCCVASTDKIRERMGDVNDMSNNKAVFEQYHELIGSQLGRYFDVYADATNLRDFAREKLREIAKDHGAEVHVFVFTNLSEAIVRNTKRDRTVPVDAMIRMLEQYEKALRDIPNEEYDSVTFIESLT